MPVVSKEEALRQYSELTGLDDFQRTHTSKSADVPPIPDLRQGEVIFVAAPPTAVRDELPLGYDLRALPNRDTVAVFRKPGDKQTAGRLQEIISESGLPYSQEFSEKLKYS